MFFEGQHCMLFVRSSGAMSVMLKNDVLFAEVYCGFIEMVEAK